MKCFLASQLLKRQPETEKSRSKKYFIFNRYASIAGLKNINLSDKVIFKPAKLFSKFLVRIKFN